MNLAFCTIITPDHLSYALALRHSLRCFGNDLQFHILIVKKVEGIKEKIETSYSNTTISFTEDICENGIAKAIYLKYYRLDVDAFRWSMKPVFIKYLLTEANYDKVVYADCDIHFFNDYHFLLDELDTSSVLLTPHWRSSNPHIDPDNFQTLYTSGIYNGGFIGATKSAVSAMEWWANACEFICVKDACKGMFVDQTHLNLLAVYFDNVRILKHRGCNVANWNMAECRRGLTADNATVIIAEKYPIVFIHFTQSTINGIYSGTDRLLLPHLEIYYECLNYFAKEWGLPKVTFSLAKKNQLQSDRFTGITRIKNMLKRSR